MKHTLGRSRLHPIEILPRILIDRSHWESTRSASYRSVAQSDFCCTNEGRCYVESRESSLRVSVVLQVWPSERSLRKTISSALHQPSDLTYAKSTYLSNIRADESRSAFTTTTKIPIDQRVSTSSQDSHLLPRTYSCNELRGAGHPGEFESATTGSGWMRCRRFCR